MRIVQIGCNDGNDEMYEMISNDPDTHALLIDANDSVLKLTKERYSKFKNVIIYNELITGTSGKYEFIIPHFDDHPYSAHSSVYMDHIINHNHDINKVKKITMNGITLDQLLDKFKITEIDYLMIDCEGEDYNIIKSLDLIKYNIKKIKFEISHFPDKENALHEICEKFKSSGYDEPIMVEGNYIFAKI